MAYPNPTNGLVNFKLNISGISSIEVRVYNLPGQSVGIFHLDSDNLQLDLSHLSGGLYYYSIKKGEEILQTGKIIKK